jgi:hypothetical protein
MQRSHSGAAVESGWRSADGNSWTRIGVHSTGEAAGSGTALVGVWLALPAERWPARRRDRRRTRRAHSATPGDQRTPGALDPTACLREETVRFEGRLVRDGKWWLAEIPLLDAMTQGRTRKEALLMIGDWLETMVDKKNFRATVFPRGKAEFEVAGSDAAAMTALLLRRRREASGRSLREIASRLGASSRNSYARYERGDAVPTIEKLDALLKATSPTSDFVIRESGT